MRIASPITVIGFALLGLLVIVQDGGDSIATYLPIVGFVAYVVGTAFLIIRSRDMIGIGLVVLGWLLILFSIVFFTTGGPGAGRPNSFTINNVAFVVGVTANLVAIYRMARVARVRGYQRQTALPHA